MATYYSQGTDLWSTLANWDTNTGGGGSDPASVADMDDDAFVIQAGHTITMDADMSAFANGIGLLISGIAAGTPGMLCFKNGTNGFLKIKTGLTINGGASALAVYGRILVNSDGDWTHSTALAAANKAIISLVTTASIISKWLDIKVYCTQPTTFTSVRTYGQIFAECAVSAAADTLTYTGIAAALPNGRLVRVSAGSGALPAELTANTDYWVVGASGNTIQLATSSGGSAINLSAGGPINVHCGWYANWGISGDTLTKTTHGLANGTAVMVKSSGVLPTPLVANTMYYVVSTAAGAISLAYVSGGTAITLGGSPSGTLDVYTGSTGAPGLGGTNPYTSTMVNVLDDVSADSTVWVAGAGTFATTTVQNAVVLADEGPADYDQQRLAFSAVTATTMTLSAAVDSVQYPNARIWLASRNVAIQSSCVTVVNIVDSTNGTVNIGIFQCEIRSTAGTGTTFYGYGITLGFGHTISGPVSGNNSGINSGFGHTISGPVSGNNYGVNSGYGHTISGPVSGNNYGVYLGFGHTISGPVSGNSYNFRSGGLIGVVCRNVDLSIGTFWYDRNTAYYKGRIRMEHYNGTLNAHRISDMFGDIIRTACDGAGDAPSVDPDGGHGDCTEVSSIQSNCSAVNILVIFDWEEGLKIWCAAGTYTFTFKIQASYGAISAGDIILKASYLDGVSGGSRAIETENATAIAQRANDADWTQTIHVHVTSAQEGFVKFYMEFHDGDASDPIYIWPVPTVS